jgi:hypothetical protein
MRQLTCLAVVVVLFAGCRDNSPLQQNQPTSLNALIFDGAHSDGNKDFFFLPPLVSNPTGSPNFDAGKFNSHLAPFVEVCELRDNPILVPTTDCNMAKPLVFSPARMSLDAGSEQYQANWDTKSSILDATRFYRITVRGAARGTALGFVDVDPVLGGMKNVKTGEIVAFQDGRTLPIKVRIEQGAFGSGNASDRVEQVVPNIITGGTLDITTNTGFAGARFANGWLPLGIDQVVVIIERIPVHNGRKETSCLNIGLEELEGCYRFRTDPDLHGLGVDGTDLLFRIPVIAGVCFQLPGAGSENGPPFALHRREEIRGVLIGPAEELEDVSAPFLRCDGFGATPPSVGAAFRSGRLGDIAKAGLFAVTHAIGRLIQPRALHAVDFGAGGSTNEFSRFGYARRAAMSVTSGDGATATAGSTIQAAVQVRGSHHDLTPPVVGQSVTFTVTGGGGTVSTESCNEGTSCPATTNSDGTAGVTWRLGLGVNTIQVTTNYVTNSPQTITATGTPTIFQASFSAETVDLAPQAPDIGSWELVLPTDGTILVRSGVADLTNQPVEVANAGVVAGTPALHGLVAGTPPTTGVWTVRWRSVMSSASESGWSTTISVLSGGIPTSNIAIISYLPNGQLNYGNSFSTDDQVARWVLGQAQQFELTIDLDAKVVRKLTIDGDSVLGGRPFLESAAASIGRIRIGGGGTAPNTLGWDDVEITAVVPVQIGLNRANAAGKREGLLHL